MSWYLRLHLPDGIATVRELDPGIYSVGADPENRIALTGSSISGRHAILTLRTTGAWIEDLNTPEGTYLDECSIAGRVPVPPGQPVRIGPCHLTLFAAPPPADNQTALPAAVPPAHPSAPEPAPSAPPPPADHQEAPVAPALDLRVIAQKQTIKRQIHQELLTRLDIKRLTTTQVDERELHKRVLNTIETIVGEVSRKLPPEVRAQSLIKEIYDEAIGLGPLEDLLADDDVNEIMVNGHNRIYIERHGRLELTDRVFLDDRSVMAIIERIVSPLGRRIDESQPYVDARLRDGSRVNAIIHPLSITGPCITIRKFARVPFTDEDLT
ncbi:MAG: ATPase, T2SS/T4P/T4SS family, partial [bacterium]